MFLNNDNVQLILIFWVNILSKVLNLKVVLTIKELTNGLVNIFYLYLNEKSLTGIDFSLLDDEELETYYKYKVNFKKEEFLAGRVLAKTVLSKYLGTKPVSISFIKNRYGKLYLKDDLRYKIGEPLHFNISHSSNMIVFAVALGNEIGVDVEKVDRPILDIAERFFTLEEKKYISKFEPGRRNQIAYKIWTLKEAYIKAKGQGFSIPLESIDIFSLDKEVFLKSILLKPEYYMAIAADSYQNQGFRTGIFEVNDLSQLAISF